MKSFELHFDGGCKPNPGQGYGSFEIIPKLEIEYSPKVERIPFGQMTSNQAEYHALNHALGYLWLDCISEQVKTKTGNLILPKSIHLKIYSDSVLVVNQLNNGWKSKNEDLTKLITESRSLLKQFGHWKISWRPRQFNVARFGH